MLITRPYKRELAQRYAQRWALSRNPLFYNFTGIGGDCTNFVSQCIYAGCCVMNYTPTFGWYYRTASERTASWTGVEYFYDFITKNAGPGPYAREIYPGGLELGDVIQLQNAGGVYYHTLLVTGFRPNDYLVSAHSNDSLDRPLSTYSYANARFLHIEGVHEVLPDWADAYTERNCFRALINGVSL